MPLRLVPLLLVVAGLATAATGPNDSAIGPEAREWPVGLGRGRRKGKPEAAEERGGRVAGLLCPS